MHSFSTDLLYQMIYTVIRDSINIAHPYITQFFMILVTSFI